MSSIVTSNLYGLILFVWVVSALTSSVINEVKTDATTLITSSGHASTKNDDHSLTSVTESVTEPITSTNMPKNGTSPAFAGEGGPISIETTNEHVPPVASHSPSLSDNLNTNESVSKKTDNTVPISKNSTSSKIVARKGANPITADVQTTKPVLNESTFIETKPVADTSAVTKAIHIDKEHDTDINNTKTTDINDEHVNNSSITITNTNSQETSVSQQMPSTTVTSKASLVKIHKPKPTVTIGELEVDKPIRASPTKSSPLGMPRKIDYIVPIVITVIVVPLLAAASFIVYKQGRDCWDKRHYRRMDFLIDGMYND